jgi:hypothetical protein
MQEMRHRRFHPDDELVKRNGFDPRLESHVALVWSAQLVSIPVPSDKRNEINQTNQINRLSPAERNTR